MLEYANWQSELSQKQLFVGSTPSSSTIYQWTYQLDGRGTSNPANEVRVLIGLPNGG